MNFIKTGEKFSLNIEGNNWEKKVKSIIVPKGKVVTGYGVDDDGEAKVFGPYYGYIKINKFEGDWKKMEIKDLKPGSKRILLCSQNDLGGKCGSVLYDKTLKNQWIELNNVGGINFQVWTAADFEANKVRSIEIPEGVSVRFMMLNYWYYKQLLANPKKKFDYEIGPFRGPTTKNIQNEEFYYIGSQYRYEKIYQVKFVDE